VTADALNRAKNWTPDGIRDALKATTSRRLWPVKFEDKEGYQKQNFHETLAIQVQKGEFETVWPRPTPASPMCIRYHRGRTGSKSQADKPSMVIVLFTPVPLERGDRTKSITAK